MPTRQTSAEPGRVYRKIAYGPLLDVFLIDMARRLVHHAHHPVLVVPAQRVPAPAP